MQEIVIPWRDTGCLYRRRHFEALYEYYSQRFKVVIGDNEGEFSRSAARNVGVSQTTSEIITVIDADNLILPSHIFASIYLAKRVSVMIKPFKWFGYLSEVSTEHVYAAGFDNADSIEKTFQSPPEQHFNGGAYTISKHNWDRIGGFDENFKGWGAEDDAFHIACNRLGAIRHVSGHAYHLYHPAERITSKENYNYLMEKYVNGNITS